MQIYKYQDLVSRLKKKTIVLGKSICNMFKTRFRAGVWVFLLFKSFLVYDRAIDLCWEEESSQ